MRMLLKTGVACAVVALGVAGCARSAADAAEQTDATAAAGKAQELSEMNFKAQTAQGVVLVDFWAPWCGPCRTQGPIVDRVAGQVGDKAKIAKLNVDKAGGTAQAFGVRSIPTLIIFKDGEPVKRFTGVTQADVLVKAINELL